MRTAEELRAFLEEFKKNIVESSTFEIRDAISDVEARAIAAILRNNPNNVASNLLELTINGSQLSNSALQAFADATDSNHSLTTLNIINMRNIGDPEDAMEMIEIQGREVALNKIESNIKRNKDEAARATASDKTKLK